jgi:hypothetical protein
MNNIIKSSGVYDINLFNSISNNTTILSTFDVSGLTRLSTTTINSSLNWRWLQKEVKTNITDFQKYISKYNT